MPRQSFKTSLSCRRPGRPRCAIRRLVTRTVRWKPEAEAGTELDPGLGGPGRAAASAAAGSQWAPVALTLAWASRLMMIQPPALDSSRAGHPLARAPGPGPGCGPGTVPGLPGPGPAPAAAAAALAAGPRSETAARPRHRDSGRQGSCPLPEQRPAQKK